MQTAEDTAVEDTQAQRSQDDDVWTELSLPMKLLLEQWGVPYGTSLPLKNVGPALQYAFLMDPNTSDFPIMLKLKGFRMICSGDVDTSESCIVHSRIIYLESCKTCQRSRQ
jgi:hypothetical protein